ncbi:hypothetical protein, partial [Lactococcus petauri]|uniref:hypothetical protein n=1 Tax=Lactococcus petauri TaxID=1940789 RepID=UPI0021F1EE33
RNPRYNIEASLVPMLRGVAQIDIGIYAHTFSTGWIRLNAFRIPIASETFTAHAGTPREFFEDVGYNTFTRTSAAAAAAAVTP